VFPLLQIITTRPDIGDRTRGNRFLDEHGDIGECPGEEDLDVPARVDTSVEGRWSANNRCMRRIKRIRLPVVNTRIMEKEPLRILDNLLELQILGYRDKQVPRNFVS
jgi:hypothetical protein